jgi:hypothetical protein
MDQDLERSILKRIEHPGWTTTRALLRDPHEEPEPEEVQAIEEVMKSLARRGLVTVWKLVYSGGTAELMAAARPDLSLDEELESRWAWATAERMLIDE